MSTQQAENPTLQMIENLIKKDQVVLFMKGNKNFPMCGFSSAVVQVLNNLGVDFADYNVLENEEIRQGVKDYANWPTIPQLYINGEFIGGADITREMYQSGELQELLKTTAKQ